MLKTTNSTLTEHSLNSKKYYYELWEGKNKLFLRGRLYAGPQVYMGVLTLLYSVCYTCISYYIYFTYSHSYYIPLVLNILLSIPMNLCCFICIFSDPGVFPRQKIDREEVEANRTSNPQYEPKYQFNKGHRLIEKFCHTCLFIRPPTTSHCKHCDNCIEKLDHHCSFLGNCIGKRNYKYFFVFIFSYFVLLFVNLLTSSVFISEKSKSQIVEWYKNESLVFVQLILTLLTAVFLGIMNTYHIYFIFNNLTTYAHSKIYDVVTITIFHSRESILANLKDIFCKKSVKRVVFTDAVEERKSCFENINNSIRIRNDYFFDQNENNRTFYALAKKESEEVKRIGLTNIDSYKLDQSIDKRNPIDTDKSCCKFGFKDPFLDSSELDNNSIIIMPQNRERNATYKERSKSPITTYTRKTNDKNQQSLTSFNL